ncbi:ATP-dependent helicase [Blattabacterium cuenoti]|uniref:ATP-dependent helicase n=1 Tax=Blattabacterium cuenoti TaxID=1653831 RepID=UPI00163CF69F|nr:UvrD-helicase domain-containing protein [Blattabacterium cuenoti]
MKICFNNLNDIQKKIIKTIHGPVLVIAGAGSGKTRVIVYRIAHMIQNMGINPCNILTLTFTNKSAIEMKNRISIFINDLELNKLNIGTFHSIFSKILRHESKYIGYDSNYTIYDKKDSENIIKKILEKLKLDKIFNFKTITKIISNYKNNFSFSENIKIKKSFKEIYDCYVKQCFKSKALDFDDILLYTNYIFYYFPEVLIKYQNKFKYILIDEYQDTNIIQHNIIKHLSIKNKNIFVVGDDFQNIYTFRGAKVSNIKNFHIEYNKTKIFYLEQNYRSTDYIVKASNKIISFNKNQILKNVWTNNEKGEKIKIYGAYSDREEAQYIVESIISIKKNSKYQYKDFSILYRTNSQSYIIEYVLKNNKIPYKIYGNISLEKRKEIKDILSYLNFINNPNDEESLSKILKINTKNKEFINFIIKSTRERENNVFNIIQNINSVHKTLMINKKIKNKIQYIFYILKKIFLIKNKINAYEIIENIINNIFLHEKYYNNKSIVRLKYFFLQEKKLEIKKNISITEFLQDFYFEEKNNISKEHEYVKNDKVSLMTVHLSKGLEFPVVFITGLEENIFPSTKFNLNVDTKKIEEERRLFYVAITRAKKLAILTYAKYRFLWGNKKINDPSRFINEISKDFISIDNINTKKINNIKCFNSLKYYDEKKYNLSKIIKKGEKVFHKKFGLGIVLYLQNNNQIATIKFQKLGVKKILLKLNKLITL